jgi:hypothetical protein
MAKSDIPELKRELETAVGKRASRLRRLIEAEEGSSGDYDYTGIPCWKCRDEGKLTNGGYTPRLVRRVDDGSNDLYCMGTHGLVFHRTDDIGDAAARGRKAWRDGV